ncbi:MAG: hypothetical protein GWO24_32330 [Akkermansiaceae bacterium]|nr:hypothetical protein [Akkermansiaceae bacterium]
MTPRQRFLLILPGLLFVVAFGSFELGRWGGERMAERRHAAARDSRASDLTQDDDALVKMLLAQDLEERSFAFSDVVTASAGRALHPFDPAAAPFATVLAAISSAADEVVKLHNLDSSPVRALRRINEASRFFEDDLRRKIDAHPALFCTIPHTSDGSGQRSGYPDLRIEHVESGTVVYLDPKLFEQGHRDSSLRTFYYTPRNRSSKVRDDASHLLLGISHDGNDGQWTFNGWELVDLASLQVRLKAEFHASNRDLYQDEARVAGSPRRE